MRCQGSLTSVVIKKLNVNEFLGHSYIPSSKLPDIMSPFIYRRRKILLHKARVFSTRDLVGA